MTKIRRYILEFKFLVLSLIISKNTHTAIISSYTPGKYYSICCSSMCFQMRAMDSHTPAQVTPDTLCHAHQGRLSPSRGNGPCGTKTHMVALRESVLVFSAHRSHSYQMPKASKITFLSQIIHQKQRPKLVSHQISICDIKMHQRSDA